MGWDAVTEARMLTHLDPMQQQRWLQVLALQTRACCADWCCTERNCVCVCAVRRVFFEQLRSRADKLRRNPPPPPKDLSAPQQVRAWTLAAPPPSHTRALDWLAVGNRL